MFKVTKILRLERPPPITHLLYKNALHDFPKPPPDMHRRQIQPRPEGPYEINMGEQHLKLKGRDRDIAEFTYIYDQKVKGNPRLEYHIAYVDNVYRSITYWGNKENMWRAFVVCILLPYIAYLVMKWDRKKRTYRYINGADLERWSALGNFHDLLWTRRKPIHPDLKTHRELNPNTKI